MSLIQVFVFFLVLVYSATLNKRNIILIGRRMGSFPSIEKKDVIQRKVGSFPSLQKRDPSSTQTVTQTTIYSTTSTTVPSPSLISIQSQSNYSPTPFPQ